jgi:succinoglycan biosynthesis transport protein ExoP
MSQLSPYTRGGVVAYDEGAARSGEVHDLLRAWSVIAKRWRLFLALWFGFVTLVALATYLTPKSYTTTARLMAGRPSRDIAAHDNDTALPILNALVLQNGEQTAETFAQLAQQHDIAQDVIAAENLHVTPRALLGRLSVKPVVNTALLNLSVSWRSPEEAAAITNAFADAFIEQERSYVRSEAVAALGFLGKELPKAQGRLRIAQGRLARFQATHGYIDATAHEQDVASRVGALDQRIDQLTIDAIEASSLLASVTRQEATLKATVDSEHDLQPNPLLADLRAKLVATETQLADARQEYTPQHPAVIALERQRAALLSQIAAQPQSVVSRTSISPNPLYGSLEQQAATYRARIEGDDGQLRALRARREAYGATVAALPSEVMAYAAIRDEATRAENVYSALARKYSDAQIATTTAISDIFVVESARPESAVRRPSLVTNVSVALLAALLLAFGIVYVLDLLDHRAIAADASSVYGLPVLARIPAFAPSSKRMLPWAQSMTIEAFLHLCVALKRVSPHRLRSLVVLSPSRGDGKSTVAFNLASAMASLQPRVLLIDADMRRPTLHQRAGRPNDVGLSDVLRGTLPLDDAVQSVLPGFDLLTSGGDAANPVAALEFAFESLLRTAQERYAMVIVDAPAASAVSDGLFIATHVDGTVLVVSKHTDDRSTRKTLGQIASLRLENLLGIVLNREPVRVTDYDDYFTPRALDGAPS